ncbi:MAG TPA: 16S rRNA (cytosine(967)-C(5))-methyltransferase RsmB [Erysipelotrichaceae bacterium]|nr:16S rRNA (cytosine(967)-C(5))-methyltransferase RsmB [Erysipelotrichaceae bacterium]
MENIKKAYEILLAVRRDHAYSNLMLQNLDDSYNVNFITQLVYGSLRNYRLIRAGWSQFVKDDLDIEISVLLDLGVYMINDIKNTPDYAIVNNLVEISKSIEHTKYTKLTNAVLKKYLKQGFKDLDEDNIEGLALKYSHPQWLVAMWKAHYGLEVTKKILKYNNTQSQLTLRVNTHKVSVKEILEDDKFTKLDHAQEAVLYEGNIFQTDYFKDGRISIQDSASQLVGHTVGAATADKVLDTCSAPGTKAFHIASLRGDRGQIDAVELHESRANLIKADKERLGLDSVKVINNDATRLETFLEKASYDKVLVDAPCSGFGVMRGKPEIKIFTQPENIDELVKLQADILDSAVLMVKVGGELIYSTCTLNKKENERQVERILNLNDNFDLLSEEVIFGFENNSDSFYIAKLKRIA